MGRPPEHPPGWATRPENYYSIKVHCENCGNIQDVSISKGTRYDSVLQDFECDNCGCVGTLEKSK